MDMKAVHDAATEWAVPPLPLYDPMPIMIRKMRLDQPLYAITYGDSSTVVWDKVDQDWAYQSLPSSRTDEFLERTRFDNFEEAWNIAVSLAEKLLKEQAEIMEAKRKQAAAAKEE